MSRLDDELRKAFKREQPPADFTERLLKLAAQQPEQRARWWQRLATLMELPKLRWVAIGVTASLLLAIGAAQYRKLNETVVSDNNKVATGTPAPQSTENTHRAVTSPDRTNVEPKRGISNAKGTTKRAPRPANQRIEPARYRQERELRAEGQAAKETLMLALSIASSALSDAQKAVHDDGLKP
jgi:hypothetical protein